MGDSVKDQLLEQLDDLLRNLLEAEELAGEAQRARDAAQSNVSALEDRARKLRMAVYALDGDIGGPAGKSFGHANEDNHKRKTALRRGDR